MRSFIHAINLAFNLVFDLIHRIIGFLPPFWSLTLISLLTGWLMLWIFGKTSKQKEIKIIKNRIRGHFLSIRLFSEHLGVFFRIQWRILRDTLRYMKFSLIPLLVMMVPVIMIMIQIHLHYAARPLKAKEQVVVKAKFLDESAINGETEVTLSANDPGVVVETQGVRIPSLREIAWRIRAEKEGIYKLTVQVGAHQIDKEVVVEGSSSRVNIRRAGKNLFDLLLYPGEAPIDPASGVESIEIKYPELNIEIFGMSMNWLVQFLVMSIVFGFLSKGLFGIEV